MQEVFEKIIEKLEECKDIMLSPKDHDCFGEECKYNDCMVCTFAKAIEIVKQEAEQYNGSELHDCKKIYDYIKTEINPYGKAFDGTAYELGLKIMDYIKNMRDANLEVQEANTKKTNSDRIRSMSDDELSVFLPKVKADYQWMNPEFPDVEDDWMVWLQSEVEE